MQTDFTVYAPNQTDAENLTTAAAKYFNTQKTKISNNLMRTSEARGHM